MSDIILGKLISDSAERDAIHVALAPVVAACELDPSERVFVRNGNAYRPTPEFPAIGIVDPFLTARVRLGETFYIMLFQNSVTGMRHEWKHPAFSQSDVGASDSKRKLEQIAAELDVTYSALMQDAERWLDASGYDGYTIQYGSENWRSVMWDRKDEFWKHYQIVTGKPVPAEKQENFYSCSC